MALGAHGLCNDRRHSHRHSNHQPKHFENVPFVGDVPAELQANVFCIGCYVPTHNHHFVFKGEYHQIEDVL